MEKIEIVDEEQSEDGWRFVVEVGPPAGGGEGKTQHSVTLDKEYWEKLTDTRHNPEELVRKFFEFLLAREPKESILREFNLQEIAKYFPEYESEIKAQLFK